MSFIQNPAPLRMTSARWRIDFLLLAMIWGSSFLFMRIAAVEFGTVLTAALRVSIAAMFLLPLLYLKGQNQALWKNWPKVFFVGVFNSALPFVLYSFAVQHITTGLSSIMNATVPLFGAFLAWIWLGDKPSLSRSLGLLLGFLGVVMLAGGEADFKPNDSGIPPLWAVGACLLATLSYAVSANFAKRYIAHVPALATATGSQCGASLALALPALFSMPSTLPSVAAFIALVIVGVLCTGLAYILYFRLIESAGPSKALTVTFLIPVFAIGYGVLLLNERITTWMLMCGAVVLIGTGLSSGVLNWPTKK